MIIISEETERPNVLFDNRKDMDFFNEALDCVVDLFDGQNWFLCKMYVNAMISRVERHGNQSVFRDDVLHYLSSLRDYSLLHDYEGGRRIALNIIELTRCG